MYKAHFKLRQNPFEITPDPAFLCPTRGHNEALATLYYGVVRRKGFVVVTGEVGTGKTLLVRCLLDVLKASNIAYAYVYNSRLSPFEFLQYVAGDLGLPTAGKSKAELLLALGSLLVNRYSRKLTTVLVVDEAHHIAPEVLEEIRLLTNLETTREKLLQILLLGQPELDEKLDAPGLRQLKQRIAFRSQIEPLSLAETAQYIERRLHLAGRDAEDHVLFPPDTILEVYRHSHGIPRIINTLCENALVTAYARQLDEVPVSVVNQVAGDFRLNIISAPGAEKVAPTGSDLEVLEAAKVLLQLREQLRSVRSSPAEPSFGPSRTNLKI